MYHTIVRWQVKKTFEQFNRGDFLSVQKMMSDRLEVHQMFQQDHALGGNRHNKAAAARWYARLVKIFPHIHFAVSDIQVKGWPWHTIITAHWQDTLTLADGVTMRNQGWHRITMRWFKITGVEMMTDETIAAAAVAHQSQQGITEAQQPPIGDNF
jgi:hypothetical protein